MTRWPLVVLLAACLLWAADARDIGDLEELVPGAFEGFTAGEGPYLYPGPESLLELYNGGYMVYVDGGVQAALAQDYYGEESYYSLVLHAINTPANAIGMVAYFRDQISAGFQVNEIELGDGGFEYSFKGTNFLYFSTGDLFVTLQGGQGTLEAIRSSARDVHERAVPEVWVAATLPLLAICRRISSNDE